MKVVGPGSFVGARVGSRWRGGCARGRAGVVVVLVGVLAWRLSECAHPDR